MGSVNGVRRAFALGGRRLPAKLPAIDRGSHAHGNTSAEISRRSGGRKIAFDTPAKLQADIAIDGDIGMRLVLADRGARFRAGDTIGWTGIVSKFRQARLDILRQLRFLDTGLNLRSIGRTAGVRVARIEARLILTRQDAHRRTARTADNGAEQWIGADEETNERTAASTNRTTADGTLLLVGHVRTSARHCQ